jgi:hypothetical protein
MRALPFLALLLATPAAAATSTYEAVRQEASCPRAKEPRSLRQTVVVLDEGIVSATPEENQRWTRIVVEAADARDVATGALGVRERFSIHVARRDGSELVPLFVGCAPNLGVEETGRARGQDSALDRFIGRDADSRAKRERQDFASGLARALAQVQRQAAAIAAEPQQPGSLVRALQNAGRLADPEQGLARFVLVTPFNLPDRASPDAAAARQRGFSLAERSGVDLGRAEVYVAGANLGEGAALDFARAFVLGSKGFLAGARSDGLPRLLPEPTRNRVYSGFIDWVGKRVPMQVRLATSAQGELVNSWVEVTVSRPVATPLNGKALCRAEACEVHGDGRFAQVWLVNPGDASAGNASFPFAGARNVEMRTTAEGAKGRVQDPSLIFYDVGPTGQRTETRELAFELGRSEGLPF